MRGQVLAAAAQARVGCRFRLNGRDPATGLDCLGVVAAALACVGQAAALPARSTLRRRGDGDADAIARAAGLVLATDTIVPGDVLLVRCSPVQLHVLVAAGSHRFVHAHAGLRRVVISPLDPGWRILARWRLPENG